MFKIIIVVLNAKTETKCNFIVFGQLFIDRIKKMKNLSGIFYS